MQDDFLAAPSDRARLAASPCLHNKLALASYLMDRYQSGIDILI